MTERISVLIVDDLPETRLNVEKLLGFEPDIDVVGHAAGGEEAIRQARALRPDVILMDINMEGLDGISATRTITQSVPGSQIIIMSVQSDADYFRRAMLSGARDFLMKPFSADELATAVRSVYESRPRMVQQEPAPTNGTAPRKEVPRSEGKLLAVYSPKGGSGVTTVAVNLAVYLAKQRQRAILLDASLQFGDVAVMLNLKTTTSVLDLLDRTEDLDADLVSSVAATHKSGLQVLTAPARPEMAELVTTAQLTSLLDFLCLHYDFVIVDTASALSDITLSVLDRADSVILVAQQRLANLKSASLFLDLVSGLGYPHNKVSLVVNRSADGHSVSAKDVESILKHPIIATIPDDEQSAILAADQGYPLVFGSAQKRPVAVALREMGAQVLCAWQPAAEVPPESAATLRLGRLFGR